MSLAQLQQELAFSAIIIIIATIMVIIIIVAIMEIVRKDMHLTEIAVRALRTCPPKSERN
jgi:hypothetical protein